MTNRHREIGMVVIIYRVICCTRRRSNDKNSANFTNPSAS
jgi:hypothetical protein